ncbi:hypothetical protein CH249_25885 [Rhodococcus sp. 05-2255-3B1]|uniref:hypothetical protein n=1 Tax=Rhodococcus sp. 05-2255-3B1 TaxID=2022482 RepID=UPI000B9BF52B|nr:hypothetical protein [Rhodococcus sp. 05-2255-3B1]OZE04366.1 hypothetical protein CH249_25885 [Rhodococcus sp. 05-2255-3B1]
MSEKTSGIWLPKPDTWLGVFGGTDSPERAFLTVVTKAPSSTLTEIDNLATAMGLTVTLHVEKKKPAGEKP